MLTQTVLGERAQLGFVVRDLVRTAESWARDMNVGPWIVIEDAGTSRQFVHRGQVSPVEMQIAFSYEGQTQIELIMPTNTAPSPYKEFLESGREGLQHLGFWPDDFDASAGHLRDQGYEEVFSVRALDGQTNVIYMNGPSHVGSMLEIARMIPFRLRCMRAIEELSRNWDGSDPIRRFASREEFIRSYESIPSGKKS